MYPLTGATTNFQSSLGVLLLLRQSPPRLSEKSRRELKSLYPTTGAATNSQSSLGVLLLLRQSPPLDCLKSLDESRKVCTLTTGATTNFQSSLGVLLLLRQSPPWSLLTENLSSHVICVLEAADVKTRAVRSQGLCKSERSFGHLPMMPLPQCQRLSDTTNDCRLRQSERSQSLQ